MSNSGQLVTFGINPKFPSTNYGYIKVNDTRESFQKVLKFTEKPSEKLAEKFIESKEFSNSENIIIYHFK